MGGGGGPPKHCTQTVSKCACVWAGVPSSPQISKALGPLTEEEIRPQGVTARSAGSRPHSRSRDGGGVAIEIEGGPMSSLWASEVCSLRGDGGQTPAQLLPGQGELRGR